MAITSRLATVFWWHSGMASGFISSPNQSFSLFCQDNFAGGRPAAITNDLPSIFCRVSQMASRPISHFLLLRQNKVTKEKATPVCRPCEVPSISRKQAGLRTGERKAKTQNR